MLRCVRLASGIISRALETRSGPYPTLTKIEPRDSRESECESHHIRRVIHVILDYFHYILTGRGEDHNERADLVGLLVRHILRERQRAAKH